MNDVILLPIADGEDKSEPLKNRIRKNYQHLRKWAKRTQTDCFRIYDRDIKEYPVAIDYYAGRLCVHYYSYDEDLTGLIKVVQTSLFSLFSLDHTKLFERFRYRRERLEQYEKQGEKKQFFTVCEYGTKFLINLVDYLDTGLFLDHRETRQLVAKKAVHKKLLNLFAYTCSFGVQAAIHGASFTKNVDLSNTYTAWGRNNYEINNIPADSHEVVRGDCLVYLDEALLNNERYDVIVIDPPTISRSKKMEGMFDVQQDYVQLILKALRLLEKGGCLFFSTNSRTFQFDISLFPSYTIQEISHKTLPIDFHNKKTHRCWQLTLRLR